MDRRYLERVKNASSPLAQREVGMDMNALRAGMDRALEVILGRPWLTDGETKEQRWAFKWMAKGNVVFWEVGERKVGGRIVEVMVADVVEVLELDIDLE